jgi:hypothetical protein
MWRNPFTMQSWSPYVVGALIGMLSWFAFGTADKHLAITLQYEHIAGLTQQAVAPEAQATNHYYAVRAEQGKSPKINWELMLLVGVFFGALASSRLSGDRSDITVPPLWRWRFGDSVRKRFLAAFVGGAVMVFGAALRAAARAVTASAARCNWPCRAGFSSSSPLRLRS